ncbi:hypothetical protein NL676_036601 [Syzygium grande]|nr:hypothetical protein NL676_036601 [Syzygium grande]
MWRDMGSILADFVHNLPCCLVFKAARRRPPTCKQLARAASPAAASRAYARITLDLFNGVRASGFARFWRVEPVASGLRTGCSRRVEPARRR